LALSQDEAIVSDVKLDLFAGLKDELENPSKYLAIFIDETQSSLGELTDSLLSLEKGESVEALQRLLVTAHRIKGSAASIGLQRAAKLAHLMEDQLQESADAKERLTQRMLESMLQCVDALEKYVDGLKNGESRSRDFDRLARQLIQCRNDRPNSQPAALDGDNRDKIRDPAIAVEAIRQSAVDDGGAKYGGAPVRAVCNWTDRIDADLQTRVAARATDHDATLIGKAAFQPGLALAGLKARLIYEKLSNAGDVCYFDPPVETLDEIESLDGVCFGLATEKTADEVRRKLAVAGIRRLEMEPLLERPHEPLSTAATPGTSPECAKAVETLRVDIQRLDQLMNLTGQIAINKARFAQIGDRLKRVAQGAKPDDASGSVAELRAAVGDLFEAVRQYERLGNDIQHSVLATRMLPIGPLFARFKRVVRDITRANGKCVNLVISGEKTELDKRMIDELSDPLIHLVRNAADHGIESPEAREAAGKPREGTIALDACHRGNSILIRVADDGGGLDRRRIASKALEKGLVSAADLERMTARDLDQLIWMPGLSTAEKVTEVSGRGMGMDIVKSKIDELSGVIELESQSGAGVAVTIKLPLTLAILPSLMALIDSQIFAVPLESVVEIVHLGHNDIATVHGKRVAHFRDRVVSMVTFNEIFNLNSRGSGNCDADRQEADAIIISAAGRQLGLLADRVLGEEDIVIKSIADNYRNVYGIAGASILGDGRVALILDPAAVIDIATRQSEKT
jgi:two-component system, chemotaxis family, sensor kinase CheA